MCPRSPVQVQIRQIAAICKLYRLRRHVLDCHTEVLETPYGTVRCKVSSGYGVERRKCEHDDLALIANERGTSISDAAMLLP